MIGAAWLGAMVGADRTAFGQTMLAHPVVASLLATSLAKSPEAALPFALALGLLSASTLPVGERHVRDWSSAAVAIPFAVGPGADPARWGVALLLVLGVAWVGGITIEAVRELVRRRCLALSPAIASGELGALERSHLLSSLLYPLRGGLVCVLAAVVGAALLDRVMPVLGPPETKAFELLWKVAPWVGLPVLFRFHLGLSSWPWLVGGVLVAVGLRIAGVWP